MNKLLIVLCLALLPLWASAGEKVTVSWTPPSDLSSTPYDGYFIYYTDSTGTGFKVPIDDPNQTEHVIPDVAFGVAQFLMTSRCNACSVPESLESNTVVFDVKFKLDPSPPILDNVVSFNAPSAAAKFKAKVAGIKYRGECNAKGKQSRRLVCKGTRIN